MSLAPKPHRSDPPGRAIATAVARLAVSIATLSLVACPTDGGAGRTPAEPAPYPRAQIRIGMQIIEAEVAETVAQKAQGLSDRVTLPQGHGMWFPYQTAGRLSFWMRNMHFPLDFVWVRDGVIVELTENVSPAGGSGTMVRPSAPADSVLEVPAGTIERWGWQVGDAVTVELATR